MPDVPVDARTAVVNVDQTLTAPGSFPALDGQKVTVQLRADAAIPTVGQQLTLFAEVLAFGESLFLGEVGRQDPGDPTARVADPKTLFESILKEIEAARLRDHEAGAEAIVAGRVVGVEKAGPPPTSEHDPNWWRATLLVLSVEKGALKPGELKVAYANSRDVQWVDAPKPRVSQGGRWVLHATPPELQAIAPFHVIHPEDAPSEASVATQGRG